MSDEIYEPTIRDLIQQSLDRQEARRKDIIERIKENRTRYRAQMVMVSGSVTSMTPKQIYNWRSILRLQFGSILERSLSDQDIIMIRNAVQKHFDEKP